MGRIAVHIHGLAKEKAYGEMLKVYGDRIKPRGINLVFHNSKKSLAEYFSEINKKSSLYLLDESGIEYTSRGFTKLVKEWTVSNRDVNLAIGPVDGWEGVQRSRRQPNLVVQNDLSPRISGSDAGRTSISSN